VVECENQVDVDGGAGNLVRNLGSLCQKEINFFHACCFDEPGEYKLPTKIRYYMKDKIIYSARR